MFDRASDEGKPVSAVGSGVHIIENYQHIAAQLISRTAKSQGAIV
jgi:hypothetical protein